MEHVRDARVLRVLMGRVLNQIGLLDHISSWTARKPASWRTRALACGR